MLDEHRFPPVSEERILEAAREACFAAGVPWTDPRTNVVHYPTPLQHFVSASCEGEKCHFDECGHSATHKVGEEHAPDAPVYLTAHHNLTAYVCCEHFKLLMGSAAGCPVAIYHPPT